ncbi:EAL domain-containing protein [Iamia sp. SCSIO 61187]|uniref:EAL domain-containing protein n=1 Tax=Iamia sp. SCSIO 61187 TaxID=2722752 RepID=UPI002107D4BA|nr:EAL domain-containing protein [Iamia sp. SCSIO 61187]
MREATRATAALRADGHDVGVAVNLSVRNLFDTELLGELERALGDAGLDPRHLVVELTESEIMDDPSVALAQFRASQALGVGTSVDDFGTGYSSLTYIRDLPLTELKVDRSFVADLHQRGGAYTIVRSMIDLGHNLGLEVVAKGVEHPDDTSTLVRLGCDRAQGYAIARPMPEADLARWLDAHARGERTRCGGRQPAGVRLILTLRRRPTAHRQRSGCA